MANFQTATISLASPYLLMFTGIRCFSAKALITTMRDKYCRWVKSKESNFKARLKSHEKEGEAEMKEQENYRSKMSS